MLSQRTISAVGFLSLCLVVCVRPETETASPSAFDGYPDEPCTIKLSIHHFRLILSWELENKPSPPANYTLWYTIMSKNENLVKVKNCSDIMESSCDVTDELLDGLENYFALVVVHREDPTVCVCSEYIVPANVPLEPPEFEIVGFTDHINVTMKFPPVTSKIIQEKLRSTPFVIKEQIEDSIKIINFRHFLTWIFPEWPPSETIDRLEVIPTNKRKKVWNYDYGDSSDSDEEVPKASVTGYTMHGLMGKPLPQTSDLSANPEDPLDEEDSGAEESEEAGAGAGAEPQLPTEVEAGPSEDPSSPYERRKSVLMDSFPREDNSSMDGAGDNVIFNVNLNSVFLRVLHDDDSSETLSLTEDTLFLDEGPHRTESDLRIAGGDKPQPLHPSLSSQGLWTEDGSSEKTDSSDSDVDAGDGYIMR
ncbi:interferon alpha/beta receptor 2 isoform X2 [Apodemus sylvaticus]|uniref:interferon alpha/beta receptor 2 isoform X2 n=1 Tax=Apodemus sylvaticus TaxID=10129 RepID=UPI002242C9DF|nr:interferon alpha/beta receptor 2 isoform X2 [Apodemus sylvaticus]